MPFAKARLLTGEKFIRIQIRIELLMDIFSRILPRHGKIEIGQKFEGSELSPLLCRGVMLATFQIDGKVFVLILRLLMCKIRGNIMGPAILSNRDVIPSIPQEELGERSLITVAIGSGSVKWSIFVKPMSNIFEPSILPSDVRYPDNSTLISIWNVLI